MIEYFRQPRMRRHDAFADQGRGNDQPHSRSLQGGVLHTRTHEQRHSSGEQQRRHAQVDRDDTALISMRRIGERGLERPHGHGRQHEKHDGALCEKRGQRDQRRDGRPAKPTPIERAPRRHRDRQQPESGGERDERGRQRVEADQRLSARGPAERRCADRERTEIR